MEESGERVVEELSDLGLALALVVGVELAELTEDLVGFEMDALD